jgi:hypothetical protein
MLPIIWNLALVLSALPAITLIRFAAQFKFGAGPQGQDVYLVFSTLFALWWGVLGAVNGILFARGLNAHGLVKFALVPVGAAIASAVVVTVALLIAGNAGGSPSGPPNPALLTVSAVILAVFFIAQLVIGIRLAR